MITDEIPDLPFQKSDCDFLDIDGESYLVIANYYSKWFELVNAKSTTSVIQI